MQKIICLDAGHGGKDSGAEHGGVVESQLALDLAMRCNQKLKMRSVDNVVLLTRDRDKFVELSQRCKIANDAQADIFVSLHFNAAKTKTGNGTEVLYCPGSYHGKLLASNIYSAMQRSTEGILKGRGIKTEVEAGRDNLTVLHKTIMPAVIVESLFLSNEQDRSFIEQERGREVLANAIVEGIENYLVTN